MITIIPSKNRAMQLDGVLRSLRRYVITPPTIVVFYKTTDDTHKKQYEYLIGAYKEVKFIKEAEYKTQLMDAIAPYSFVMFFVDDIVLTRQFHPYTCAKTLLRCNDALGFSLRLGVNVTRYARNNSRIDQPKFDRVSDNAVKYKWVDADKAFNYPLEIASSIYRTKQIYPIIANSKIDCPQNVETRINSSKGSFKGGHPFLLCYSVSIAFANQINVVQTVCNGKHLDKPECNAYKLSELFNDGWRINIDQFDGFTSDSTHQQIEPSFVRNTWEK